MKISSPPPQAVPDPYATARAQGQANLETAIGNTYMSNADEWGPGGTVRYERTGLTPVAGQEVPRFRREVTLAPAEQKLYDQENARNIQLGDIAQSQLGRAAQALGSPLTTEGLRSAIDTLPTPSFAASARPPHLRANIGFSEVGTQYDRPSRGVEYASTGFGDTPALQYGIGDTGTAYGNIADVGRAQRSIAGAGPIATSFADTGWARGEIGDAGAIQRSVGAQDFSADGLRVQQALLDRAQPETDRSRAALESQLVNQGLVRGTEQFNAAMDQQARQENDLRLGAILAGGQEQSRLFGMDLSKGQFANDAQGRAFAQNAARTTQWNDAVGQNYGMAQGRAQFQNQGQAQLFGQNAAQAGMYNAGQAQDFDQAATRSAAADAAVAQREAQLMGRMQAYNAAQQIGFGQQQARGMFGLNAIGVNNAAQAQEEANLAARAGFAREGMNTNNQTRAAEAAFANDAAMTGYGMETDARKYDNQMAQQAFANYGTAADFANTARERGLQERAALRNQPLQDIAALTSGTQINIPQFAQFKSQQYDPAPVAQSVYQSAGLAMDGWKAQQQAKAQMMGGLFGGIGSLAGGLFKLSDHRLKSNIVALGVRLPNGLPLYSYTIGGRSEVGVMANEVEAVMPDAVAILRGGFKAVDYGKVLACP